MVDNALHHGNVKIHRIIM